MSTQQPPLNVLIVGGVAGGMSCATRLRRNLESAHITVLEKGPYVSYANCGIPYALGGVIADEAKLHVQTPEKMAAWFGVDVKTETELLHINREKKTVTVKKAREQGAEEEMGYDKLVLAMGAQAMIPPIKGVDAPHVFTLQTIPDLQSVQAYIRDKQPKTATIIGGGFIGLEAAENLQALGIEVTVFEFFPHVFPPVDADIAEVLQVELKKNGIKLMLSSKVTDIVAPTPEGSRGKVVAEGKEAVEADMVILSAGVRPRVEIPVAAGLEKGKVGLQVNAQMQTSDPEIYAVGDMVETMNLTTNQPAMCALAGPANRQGRLAADHIAGKEVAYRGNLGASVCKVFSKTVGLVGMSNEMLRKNGLEFEYVTVHPPDHAGYYPGACPLTVKVSFDKEGAILGAQVVGEKAVDKRVDVLATAMRAGMKITDLEHLELSYAPPYGSAKDAVNMAAFAASNILRGDSHIVHAEDFGHKFQLEEYQVVDVRSPEEFAKGHVKGAMNIPIGQLRDRLGELDPGKKVLSYCWVGYRGYLGYRILKQKGFEVVNLDGGFKAVSEGGFTALVE